MDGMDVTKRWMQDGDIENYSMHVNLENDESVDLVILAKEKGYTYDIEVKSSLKKSHEVVPTVRQSKWVSIRLNKLNL